MDGHVRCRIRALCLSLPWTCYSFLSVCTVFPVKISSWVVEGAVIKKTPLGEEFGYDEFKEHYGENAIPLLSIDENRKLRMFTTNDPPKPQPGHLLISLVRELNAPNAVDEQPDVR